MSKLSSLKTLPCCVLKSGSGEEIFKILRQKIDLKCEYENSDTVYHLILKNEKLTEEEIISISKIFLARGLNPNTRNQKDKSALHLTVEKRMRNVTDFFLKYYKPNNSELYNKLVQLFIEDEHTKFWYPVSQDDNNSFGDSEKTESESAAFLEWLISKDITCLHKNNKGKSPLEMAVEFNLQHLLPTLLKYAIFTNLVHSKSSQSLLFKFLERNRASKLSYRSKPGIHWYCSYASRYVIEIVKMLVNKGAAVNSAQIMCIESAIRAREEISIIKILVNYLPKDCTERRLATSLLNELIEYTCAGLSDSEINCYLQILDDLTAKGANVNEKNKSGLFAVQLALKARNICALNWLNERGSNFSVLTSYGESLLHLFVDDMYSKTDQETEIFDFLVNKGCKVNGKTVSGLTPLHLAAWNDRVALVIKLIEHGADINCRDKTEETPLHFAARKYNPKLVEMLLKNGANVNAKNVDGENSLYFALRRSPHCLKMVKVLLEWGAQVNALLNISNGVALRTFVLESINETIFKEFLKYGLDVIHFDRLVHKYDCNTSGIVHQHWIKLKAAELPCSERSGLYAQRNKKFYENCLKEVKLLKSTNIDGRTSLFQLLRIGLNGRRIYINNEKLKKLVNSPTLEKQFPQYAALILANYHEMMARPSLLESAKEAWLKLTKIYLPDICIERILSHLSNLNLADMTVVN